ncbi:MULTISPECIES: DUF4148 domain-containing protein [unclassified Caballeronia]|uniref:DUF4148 domain-containing protein n=1 Tax=unclassified Caballeronia TaxID=2646786 RepID=UPI002855FB08|nr:MULTISPECIES: DUF4148 domain-containing protein [unclassified Caballeronia]MDR5739905.1 DUF4148 domain-containing protein [Caballeronia sp. LZ016]MDR5808371.1 DUF4148 domain-containing protein [Caballeronia sp. LZ019]
MNSIAKVVVSVAAIVAPALSFAQSNSAPLTRAQVRAELAQLQAAGYSTAAGENATYPADIQAAEARVAAQQSAASQSYGGMQSGEGASGTMQRGASSASTCVGPAGFCVPFFGS